MPKPYAYKYLLLLLIVGCFATLLPAQHTATQKNTPAQEATLQTEKLDSKLNLSPQQKEKIYAINLKYAKKRTTSNRRKEAIKRIKEKNREIRKVLNPKQQKEFEQNKRKVKSEFSSKEGEKRHRTPQKKQKQSKDTTTQTRNHKTKKNTTSNKH